MKYLELLKVLLTVTGGKLPQVLAILNQILALLETTKPATENLEMCERSSEEEALEGQLSQALSAEGTQAVFDGSRLRKLLALAGEYGPTILTLIKMFSGV